MPALAELQAAMARALIEDPAGLPPGLFTAVPVPLAAALATHRNTILGAIAHSLRLTFPTVERLVGEAFFDQAVGAFVCVRPPSNARLIAYGDDFPSFLERYPPAAMLAYLPDVARLDLRVARAAACAPSAGRAIPIDDHVAITFPATLSVLAAAYPADEIRSAIASGDADELAAIDLSPRDRWTAIWRADAGVRVHPLAPPAGCFLARLLGGEAADQAAIAAIAAHPQGDALEAIQAGVFAAPFSTIIQTSQRGASS